MSFRFCISLPDPYHKACILCENDNISDIAPNGWGGGPKGTVNSSSEVRFGKNSASLNVSGNSCIDINYNSYYNPLSYGNDYTVELWAYPTVLSTYIRILGSAYSNSYHAITICGNSGNGGFYNSFNATAWDINQIINGSFPVNKWTHLCQTRKSNKIYNFINGTLQGTYTSTSNFVNNNSSNNMNMRIGCDNTSNSAPTTGNQYKGYVQNIKFSTICRYTESFTCPTKPY